MATQTLDPSAPSLPTPPPTTPPASLDALIVRTPRTLGGRPRIAGRRIGVQHIAYWYEQDGRSAAEIAAEFNLSLAEVHAALAYYYANRAEIAAWLRYDEELEAAVPEGRAIPVDAE